MKTFLSLVLFIIGCIYSLGLFSQTKYAVLIAGSPDISSDSPLVPPNEQLWNESLDGNTEFWNDTFLFWELLTSGKFGFSKENVAVFFGKNVDYPQLGAVPPRYVSSQGKVSDFSQTKGEISYYLSNTLSTNDNDLLFIWVLSHGWADYSAVDNYTKLHSYFWCENDEKMWDYEFAELVNAQQANKKIIIFQSCKAYGFIDDFEEFPNTICITAASLIPENSNWELGHRCDNWAGTYLTPGFDFIENEQNNYNFPDSYHAEFDYHFYSATNGKSPLYEDQYYNSELFSDADNPSQDGIISLGEAFAWAYNHESMTISSPYDMGPEHPFISDGSNIAFQTSFEYPTLLCENITNQNFSDLSVRGLIGVSKVVHVSGVRLNFLEDSKVYFVNEDAKLVIESDGEVKVNDNVKFYGNSSNSIEIKGTAEFTGTGITFESKEVDGDFGGLYINNPINDFTISNATFRNSDLHSKSQSLTLQDCQFMECDTVSSESGDFSVSNSQFEQCGLFQSAIGDLEISQTSFTQCWPVKIFNDKVSVSHSLFNTTGIYLENPHGNDQSEANIFSNTFSNTNGTEKPAIELYSVPKFNIHHNYISSGYSNGIQLSYSGIGALESQQCHSNLISGCTNSGIHNLNSNLIIQNNHIYNNQYGVRLFGTSVVYLIGDGTADLNTQTQEISDNTGYEVYASLHSFPPCFLYNIIQDADNWGVPTDPLLFHSTDPGTPDGSPSSIQNNCWGNNFDPEFDLYPVSEYYYLPYWCPEENPSPNNDPPQDLYNLAGIQFHDSSYLAAKSTYKLLVELYHESRYAQSALIDLLRLERFAENDYLALKEYYLGNDTIVNDSVLTLLGRSLANECDVYLDNYQDAINFYEDIIQNPSSAEDSVLAIVDLGHLYYIMEQDSLKAGYTGSLLQYKPKSQQEYFKNRDYLLSLLPIETETKDINEALNKETFGKLIQNIPNPVNGITTIWYRIEQPYEVSLRITDLAGRHLQTIYIGRQDRGNQKTDVNLQGMTPGVYFYSLIIERTITDTKKLTVIN